MKRLMTILAVIAIICVTSLPVHAGTGIYTDRRGGRVGANSSGSYDAKLEMKNKTKNRTYRFYYRWSEKENWCALTGRVSPSSSSISKLKIQRRRVTIFLRAECVSGGSGYITTPFVVNANTTNWWGVTD
jgi:hypothetical protein